MNKGFLMRIKLIICIIIIELGLSACQSPNELNSTDSSSSAVYGAGVGALVGVAGASALYGSNPYFAAALLVPAGAAAGYKLMNLDVPAAEIRAVGGEVFQLGDFVTIILPVDEVIEPATAIFLPEARSLLEEAAVIIKEFPDDYVMVTAHTNGTGSQEWQAKLSFKQAREVAMMLWKEGVIPSDKMEDYKFAGMADLRPLAVGHTARALEVNRRIQITLYPPSIQASMRQVLSGVNVGTLAQEKITAG